MVVSVSLFCRNALHPCNPHRLGHHPGFRALRSHGSSNASRCAGILPLHPRIPFVLQRLELINSSPLKIPLKASLYVTKNTSQTVAVTNNGNCSSPLKCLNLDKVQTVISHLFSKTPCIYSTVQHYQNNHSLSYCFLCLKWLLLYLLSFSINGPHPHALSLQHFPRPHC